MGCFTDALARRGPDGYHTWLNSDRSVGLAHRRLAIIDPTAESDQPMHSADGRYTIVFNGEIYNYAELRAELQAEGQTFRTHGDTEVLLAMYQRHGRAMLDRLRGMFAFLVWDSVERTLFMARDPLGIKPLYYGEQGGVLYFASQVKALTPIMRGLTPDPAGQAGFLVWGSVPEPFTLYREIRSLPAGHCMTVRDGKVGGPERYADIGEVLAEAWAGPAPAAEDRAEMLHTALRRSVAAHLVADVPIALFLSAGLDSTVLAGLISEIEGARLTALTLGFDGTRGTPEDETVLAAEVAERYGIPFREEIVGQKAFAAEYDRLLEAMDQPSVDGVNSFFVSKLAKDAGYKVALSGLGGDELFAGYPSFGQVPRMAQMFGFARNMPALARGVRWIASRTAGLVTSPKYAGMLEYGHSMEGAYLLRRGLFMPWELPGVMDPAMAREGWAALEGIPAIRHSMEALRGVGNGDRARVSLLEMSLYMRNQLLRDADWAGMYHGVEIRVPLVDFQLLRDLAPLLVHGVPPTKQDMAAVLNTPLPENVLRRPKTGFAVPVREWLAADHPEAAAQRGLRGWARHLLRTFGATS